MDVGDEKVTDVDGFSVQQFVIKATNTVLNERIWINRVASELVLLHFILTPALHHTMSVWVQFERNPICI